MEEYKVKVYPNGDQEWYLNGENMTEEEHRIRTCPAVKMTVAEVSTALGYRVEIVE